MIGRRLLTGLAGAGSAGGRRNAIALFRLILGGGRGFAAVFLRQIADGIIGCRSRRRSRGGSNGRGRRGGIRRRQFDLQQVLLAVGQRAVADGNLRLAAQIGHQPHGAFVFFADADAGNQRIVGANLAGKRRQNLIRYNVFNIDHQPVWRIEHKVAVAHAAGGFDGQTAAAFAAGKLGGQDIGSSKQIAAETQQQTAGRPHQ